MNDKDKTRSTNVSKPSAIAEPKQRVAIPFTVGKLDAKGIVLQQPSMASASKPKAYSLLEKGNASVKVPGTRPGPSLQQVYKPEVQSARKLQVQSSAEKARITSSTELISANSFAKCSKKVTDKGITFEIKAESKPKTKTAATKLVQNTSFQRTFYVPPGEDVQKATEKVVNQITADLNKQAAEQLANGHTPDKETVIEITRIAAPPQGYFSRDLLRKVPAVVQKPVINISRNRLLNLSPEKGSEKTPPPRVMAALNEGERTPSPAYFQPIQAEKTTEVKPAPLPLASSLLNQQLLQNKRQTPLNIYTQSLKPQQVILTHSSKAQQGQIHAKPLIGAQNVTTAKIANGFVQTVIQPAVIKTSNSSAASLLAPSSILRPATPSVTLSAGNPSVKVVPTVTTTLKERQPGDGSESARPLASPGLPSPALQTVKLANQSVETGKFDPGPHDDSLTNIQWLGLMSGENLVQKQREEALLANNKDIRIVASEHQIEKISRECGRTKRPPYSYMHLIQMAISSRADKKMTLKEIYRWIEDRFPYYKYCSKTGWKNSIRHNLSLYDIFVREKSQDQNGCSYWMLRSGVSANKAPKAKAAARPSTPSPVSDDSFGTSSPNLMQVVDSQGSPLFCVNNGGEISQSVLSRSKRGPAPLLPKPSCQTYALIPIQNGLPVQLPSQSVIMPSWPTNLPAASIPTASSLQLIQKVGDGHLAGQKRSCSPLDTSGPSIKKERKIAPKILSNRSASSSQPSRPASCTPSTRTASRASMESPTPSLSSSQLSYTQSLDTTDLQSQLSGMKFDSGVDLRTFSDTSMNSDLAGSQEQSVEVKPGLPKPKMYNKSRRPRKDPHKNIRQDSSEKRLGIEKQVTPEGSPTHRDPGIGDTVSSVLGDMDPGLGDTISSDILSSIEKDFSSPMRCLLQTPPQFKDKKKYTSTPTDINPGSPSWISPIHGLTPIMGEDNPLLDSGIFTPNIKLSTSTPEHAGSSTRSRTSTIGVSPKLGSLRDLGLPGFTPFKTPPKYFAEGSPDISFNISNQSFTKLLGEFHLDSMDEDGLPVDMGNLSFSALQDPQDT